MLICTEEEKPASSVLIAEDDQDIHDLLRTLLMKAGFQTLSAYSGTELALLLDRGELPDLIVLDLMLPGRCGEELIRDIRRCSNLPILVISGKAALEDRVHALQLGADDYIVKPFENADVLARVQVQLRRGKELRNLTSSACRPVNLAPDPNAERDTKPLVYRELRLDPAAYQASWADRTLDLTQTEFAILRRLLEQPERVFSRETLCRTIWPDSSAPDDAALNTHVSNLRRKLRAASGLDLIATLWGVGYKLAV